MIVLDASAALAVILVGVEAPLIRARLADVSEVHVPEHFHLEAISGIRRVALRNELDDLAARRAVRALTWLRALRYPVLPLRAGIWARRENLSAYDAAYLALAEQLTAKLITVDYGLADVAEAEGRLVTE